MLQRGERKICHAATFEEQEFLWPLIAAKNKEKRKKKKMFRPRRRYASIQRVAAIRGNYFKRDEINRILEGIRLL